METISKITILLLWMISSGISLAQVPQMIKVDSLWVLRTISRTNDKGAYSSTVSEKVDSAKIVAYYINVMSQKKEVIDSNIMQREWEAYNGHLKTVTGMEYSQHIAMVVVKELAGGWEIITSSDTISITVSKDLRVSGGKIKGKVEVIDGSSIRLIGVLSEPVVLKADKGKLIGYIKNSKVEMKKS